jgi:hypothetical protein
VFQAGAKSNDLGLVVDYRMILHGSEGCVFESRRVQIKSQSRSAGEKQMQKQSPFFLL